MTASDSVTARADGLIADLLEADAEVRLITTLRSDFVEGYGRSPRMSSRLNLAAARYLLGALSPAECTTRSSARR
jgi:hypothetical protein